MVRLCPTSNRPRQSIMPCYYSTKALLFTKTQPWYLYRSVQCQDNDTLAQSPSFTNTQDGEQLVIAVDRIMSRQVLPLSPNQDNETIDSPSLANQSFDDSQDGAMLADYMDQCLLMVRNAEADEDLNSDQWLLTSDDDVLAFWADETEQARLGGTCKCLTNALCVDLI